MNYPEVYNRLNFEIATVVFIKKNGDVRLMLCTRNMNIISIEHGLQGKALGGHDNRCNIDNGNIAAFDLIIGEARSFNIDRIVSIGFNGIATNQNEMDQIILDFADFKEKYEETQPLKLDISMLD